MFYNKPEAISEETRQKARELKSQFPELNVEITGKWIWLSAPNGIFTRERDDYKAAGLRYSEHRSLWYYRPDNAKWHKSSSRHAGFTTIREMFGSEVVEVA